MLGRLYAPGLQHLMLSLQCLQRSKNFAWLKAVAIIHVEKREHDGSVSVDDVSGWQWQYPTVVAVHVRQRMSELRVDWAELVRQVEGDPEGLGCC